LPGTAGELTEENLARAAVAAETARLRSGQPPLAQPTEQVDVLSRKLLNRLIED
jgi:hypothetical protein